MHEIDNKKYKNNSEDEIDLRELLFALIQGRWIITSVTSFLTIIGIIYSLLLPNIYESKALLAPVDESSSLISGALSQFGGLAGFSGLSLPEADNSSNSKKAVEVMSSLSFFENYIMPNIFLPDLMATEFWDYEKNIIIYDKDIYNKDSNLWVRNFSYPEKLIPSAQESFEVFEDDYFNMTEDNKTGYVTLSIKHQSPLISKQWVETIVEEINTFYRQKDKAHSEKAVDYLNEQIAKSSLSQIKEVTSSLLQKEIQKLTLIEANKDYVFEYIYPPSIMEEKSGPNRALIVFISAFLGGLLSTLLVLFKYYVFNKKPFKPIV